MPFSIVPPPYGPGGGNVTGGGDLNNADRVVIVAGTSEVGESDVTLTTGVFSRAGTVGLSATGANVVTLSTNSVERFRINGAGTMSLINASANPVFQMGDSLAGATRKEFTITVDTTNNRVEMVSVQQGVAHRPIALNPTGGNILIGTTTDDGASKLQVFGGPVKITATAASSWGTLLQGNSDTVPFLSVLNNVAVASATFGWGLFDRGTEGNFQISYKNGTTSWNSAVTIARANGNVLVGGTTDGNYRLDVQSSGSSGTLRVYDQTAVVGTSLAVIRAGAGQSTGDLFQVQNNAGSVISRVFSDGTIGISTKTPASNADTGTAGQICWDADYIYVCTATNTWKRVAIAW